MFAILTLVLTVSGFISSNELILIAASGFAIATAIDFLRDDIKENKKEE